jgi:hypothetical protein
MFLALVCSPSVFGDLLTELTLRLETCSEKPSGILRSEVADAWAGELVRVSGVNAITEKMITHIIFTCW